jgi:hypothetical protein
MAVTEPKATDTPVETVVNMVVEEPKTVETKGSIKSTSNQSDSEAGSHRTWSDVVHNTPKVSTVNSDNETYNDSEVHGEDDSQGDSWILVGRGGQKAKQDTSCKNKVKVDLDSGSDSYGSDGGGKKPANKKRRKDTSRKNGDVAVDLDSGSDSDSPSGPTMRFNIHETFADLRYVEAIDEDGNVYQKVVTDREGNPMYFPNYLKLAAARDKHKHELTDLQLMAIDENLALPTYSVPGKKESGVHTHHIIPRSLQGHLTDGANLINVQAGRHFITHLAYDIVFNHRQLSCAVSLMKSGATAGCNWTSPLMTKCLEIPNSRKVSSTPSTRHALGQRLHRWEINAPRRTTIPLPTRSVAVSMRSIASNIFALILTSRQSHRKCSPKKTSKL